MKDIKIAVACNEPSVATRSRFNSIDYLRVLAMFLVAYDHLGAERNDQWTLKKCIDFLLCSPLSIIQDWGAFAVSLFLIISGFLAFPVKHSAFEKLKRILSRLIIPLMGSMAIFFLIYKFFESIFGPNYWSIFSLQEWINTVFLIDFFSGESNVLNGVLWYMVPSLYFAVISTFLSPITHGVKGTLKMVAIYDIALLTAIFCFPNLSDKLPFAFMPVFGIIVRQVDEKSTNTRDILVEIILTWVMMVVAFYNKLPHYYSGGGGTLFLSHMPS